MKRYRIRGPIARFFVKRLAKYTIGEECWSLDYELIKWLNTHIKVYVNDSQNIVQLDYYKFKYKGKTYTYEQLLHRLIDDTEFLLKEGFYSGDYARDEKTDRESLSRVREIYDILKLIHFYLWW